MANINTNNNKKNPFVCPECQTFAWEAFGFNNDGNIWWYNIDLNTVKIRCAKCFRYPRDSKTIEPNDRLKRDFASCYHGFQYQPNIQRYPHSLNSLCFICGLWTYEKE